MKKNLSIFIALISVLGLSALKDKSVKPQSSQITSLGEKRVFESYHDSIQQYSNYLNGYDSNIIKVQPILLVANKHSNTLSYVNPKTFKIIETIPTGPNPHEITITPDQRFAYLSSYEPPGNTISVIELLKRKQIKQISTGKYGRIHGAAMALDGKHAYFTAGQSGFVVEIDTKTNEVTRTIPTHGKISHMVYVSLDGKYLYTSNIVSENVSVIDRITGKLITQIPCGPGCEGMAFTPDGKYIWVANQTAGTITIVDIANYKPIETFECKGMPVRIRFTSDGKLALIAGWVKEGTLTIIDVTTHKEIKRIRVGDYAIGVELSPDEKFAFVGCEDSREAQVLPDGSEKIKTTERDSDGIHVIDMKTLSVVTIIKTGLGPDPMVMWYSPASK
jgi:YVTN family beta-propeller protein